MLHTYFLFLGISWAALKGTNLRGQTPICGFLRVPAKICGFLQKSAKICVSQMLCFSGKGENLQKSAKICENLRSGSVCPLRFVPLSAPWINFPRNYISVTWKYYSGINGPKIALHLFVCDWENYMEKSSCSRPAGSQHSGSNSPKASP